MDTIFVFENGEGTTKDTRNSITSASFKINTLFVFLLPTLNVQQSSRHKRTEKRQKLCSKYYTLILNITPDLSLYRKPSSQN